MPESKLEAYFTAELGGDTIQCRSQEDADGIRQAAEYLSRVDAGPYPRASIEYLSSLLRWYGRNRASRILESRHLPQTG
ncbi:hypothetical protein [Lacipirellula sp.]|uniref:hypothetical protein n=1 Tax=Lacipirellula sp. TaxID=2691419 RepID=UPI003D10083C